MSDDLKWEIIPFEKLTVPQLYELLRLRQDIFIVEQECPYPDIDNLDHLAAHLLGRNANGELIAYARLFAPGIRFPEASIGRVVIHEQARGNGTGHALMSHAIQTCDSQYGPGAIRIDAQAHLQGFYQRHAFSVCSEPHMVDGILHVTMRREPN